MYSTPFPGIRRFAVAGMALLVVIGGIAQPLVATAATNQAPWIKGTSPKNITARFWYSFKPSAGDPNGRTLKFSIVGKPTWATFSTSTGKLSGRSPTTTTGKTYSGIAIRASDGSLSATLPKFSLTVVAPASSSVTLRWLAPMLNVDGTVLTNLKGYQVEYGTASDGTAITNLTGYKVSYGNATQTYTVELNISGAATNSVVIEDLQPGAYYFPVKAVNSNGVVSDFSNEVSKVL
jgi:hypothetical protein